MLERMSLKTFGDYGGETKWAMIIKAVHCTFLWHWNGGG